MDEDDLMVDARCLAGRYNAGMLLARCLSPPSLLLVWEARVSNEISKKTTPRERKSAAQTKLQRKSTRSGLTIRNFENITERVNNFF